MILRPRHNLELSWEILAELKLDLENFCPKGREEELDLENFCPKRQKGVGLKIICPSKRDKESKVKQVRRGVRIPAR